MPSECHVLALIIFIAEARESINKIGKTASIISYLVHISPLLLTIVGTNEWSYAFEEEGVLKGGPKADPQLTR